MEQVSRIGMDTSKHIFQLHGVDAAERPVLRRKLRRRARVRSPSAGEGRAVRGIRRGPTAVRAGQKLCFGQLGRGHR